MGFIPNICYKKIQYASFGSAIIIEKAKFVKTPLGLFYHYKKEKCLYR